MASVDQIRTRLRSETAYYDRYGPASLDTQMIPVINDHVETEVTEVPLKPVRKVSAAGIAGALSILIVWALGYFAKVEVPNEVASALTAILAFGAGYIVPASADDEQVVS